MSVLFGRINRAVLTGFILLLTISAPQSGRGEQPATSAAARFVEQFRDLSAWEPLYFEDIDRHSDYEAVRREGRFVLRASSNSSASALVSKERFNVYDYPVISWRWRAEKVYIAGDAGEKAGDDFPLRVYVLFVFDRDRAGWWERMKYGAYKGIYGEYPPDSTLNYIFANREHEERVLSSAYTDRAKLIPLRQGPERTGEWLRESRNILRDYRMSFGEDPPPEARLAIMNDSDNTGESSVSYVDWIRLEPSGAVAPSGQ